MKDRIDRIEEALRRLADLHSGDAFYQIQNILAEPREECEHREGAFGVCIKCNHILTPPPPPEKAKEPVKITAENWMEYFDKHVWEVNEDGTEQVKVVGFDKELFTVDSTGHYGWAIQVYATDPNEYLKQQEKTS